MKRRDIVKITNNSLTRFKVGAIGVIIKTIPSQNAVVVVAPDSDNEYPLIENVLQNGQVELVKSFERVKSEVTNLG